MFYTHNNYRINITADEILRDSFVRTYLMVEFRDIDVTHLFFYYNAQLNELLQI